MGSELHESHVRGLRQFSDDSGGWKHFEHGLNCHYGVTVGQVIFLGRVGRFLVGHHDRMSKVDTCLYEIIEASFGSGGQSELPPFIVRS